MHESILVFRRFYWLKWSVFLMLIAIVAYWWDSPLTVPNGGTWLGYTLGTIGALLILWLMWFGVRKRRYGRAKRASEVDEEQEDTKSELENWLSAHVYLGLSLIVIATLHTGFQFAWNVHTLAYALMLLVILSGVFGLYAYIRYPVLMTENRRGQSLRDMLSEVAELDVESREVSTTLSDDVNEIVLEASQNTLVGGSLIRQISGRDPNCATHLALERVQALAGATGLENMDRMRRLLALLTRKDELLIRARRDVQIKALLDVWLYVHVPLSFALLAALATHIISVFFYW